MRILLWLAGFADYWGDAYHLYLIGSDMASDPGWAYWDYKDRHLVWLPVFPYLTAVWQFLWQIDSIQAARFLNVVLGSAACVVWVQIHRRYPQTVSWQTLAAALFLGFPLVLSVTHMAENVALLLAVLLLLSYLNRSIWLVFAVSLIMVHTRNESVLILFLVGVLFLSHRRWGQSAALAAGAAIGLAIWSVWVGSQTGDPFYWFTARLQASGAGARDIISRIGIGMRLLEIVASLLLAFPFIWLLRFRSAPGRVGWVYAGLFAVGGLFLFHGADSKYLAVALPFLLVGANESFARLNLKRLATMLVVSAGVVLVVFFFRSFNLSAEMQAGRQLETLPESIVWNDFPVSVYTARRGGHLFLSSGQLFEGHPNQNTAAAKMRYKGIRYIMVSNSDRSIAHQVFPELLLNDYVQTGELSMRKIYSTKEDVVFLLNYPVPVGRIVAMNRDFSIWEVTFNVAE